MKNSREVTRENIHTGISSLSEDTKWSDVRDFRFRNNRTVVVPPLTELFSYNGGFHSLIKGPHNSHYIVGNKKSYRLRDYCGDLGLSDLWELSHKFVGDRNERDSKDYELLVQGRYTGSAPICQTVTLIDTEDINTVEVEETVTAINCNDSLTFSGVKGVYHAEIGLGTGVGTAAIELDSFNVPDRFVIVYDGQVVADSLYVGDALSSYTSSLLAESGNSFTKFILHPIAGFVDSGTTEVLTIMNSDFADTGQTRAAGSHGNQSGVTANYPSAGASAADGNVRLEFNKHSANPSTCTLIAYGPLDGTAWNLVRVVCPST